MKDQIYKSKLLPAQTIEHILLPCLQKMTLNGQLSYKNLARSYAESNGKKQFSYLQNFCFI